MTDTTPTQDTTDPITGMSGCLAHACVVNPERKGMGTSGRCQCPNWKLHATIARLRQHIDTLARQERVKAWEEADAAPQSPAPTRHDT